MNSETDPRPIRVLLVDDHTVVRVGLRTILADDPRIRVVGEAATGAEGLRLAEQLQPTVVVLDLRLSDLTGDEVCRRLKARDNAPAVVILTSFGDDRSVLSCLTAGADGYLLKDFEQTDLAQALVQVARGGSVLDSAVAQRVVQAVMAPPERAPRPYPQAAVDRLSAQERRILELLAEGRANKEIATTLGLGEGTVRNYLSGIFTKLEVTNRTEAVVLWLQHRGTSG
jgi:DNA-binding NarL/FixJ family response regulator